MKSMRSIIIAVLVIALCLLITAEPKSSWKKMWNAWRTTKKNYRSTRNIASFQSSFDILDTCFSVGDLYQTVDALGVFRIPGVKMVKLSGNLYQMLKNNKTIKLTSAQNEQYNADVTDISSPKVTRRRQSNEPMMWRRNKRSTDICEETPVVLYEHAFENLAYQIEEVDCSVSVCTFSGVTIGTCNKKMHTIVLYVTDENGNVIPKTEVIGCACECHVF